MSRRLAEPLSENLLERFRSIVSLAWKSLMNARPPVIEGRVSPLRRSFWRYLLLAAALLLLLDAVIIWLVFQRQALPRDAAAVTAQCFPIDLTRHTNGVLHTSWLPGEDPGNNLAALPTGRQ